MPISQIKNNSKIKEGYMEVKSHRGEDAMQCVISIGNHSLISDVSPAYGGNNAGPEPHDLLAAALAACTSLTLLMYAKRKNIDLQDVEVSIQHGKKEDTYEFIQRLHYIGRISAEECEELTKIALKCPVHKTLSEQISIVTEVN